MNLENLPVPFPTEGMHVDLPLPQGEYTLVIRAQSQSGTYTEPTETGLTVFCPSPTIWQRLRANLWVVFVGLGILVGVGAYMVFDVRRDRQGSGLKVLPLGDEKTLPVSPLVRPNKTILERAHAAPQPRPPREGFTARQTRPAWLTITKSPNQKQVGKRVEITNLPFTIGRVDSVLAIDDERISRSHAKITFEIDLFYLTDMKSTNGTWIDQKRAVPYEGVVLYSGNVIRLGMQTELLFEEE